MVTKENLKEYAKKLMFDMDEKEYETLEKEFEIILKQMELIESIEGIHEVEPMTFPYIKDNVSLRADEIHNTIDFDDVLVNAKQVEDNQIKVPKVVE